MAAGGEKKDKMAAGGEKKDKLAAGEEDDGPGDGRAYPLPKAEDPFDLADVEMRWQRSEKHHEEKLKELRRALGVGGGGAKGGGGGGGDVDGVDLEAIGAAPVTLKGEAEGAVAAASAKTTTTTVPLSQLALIIPRGGGRLVELRMHSPASRKAIVRAVQANSALFHGQQPQPDPEDEMVLLLRWGAGEHEAHAGGGGSAEAAAAERVRRVHEFANGWRAQVRQATARRQKTHQAWKKDKAVRPDDLRRLDVEVHKQQEKQMARIDKVEKELLQQLERARR